MKILIKALIAPGFVVSTAWATLAVCPAQGQSPRDACPTSWEQPVACSLYFYAAPVGERLRPIDSPPRLVIGPNDAWRIEVDARDQWRRSFPDERLIVRAQPERECAGLVDVETISDLATEIRSQANSGSCRVWFWVPGNLNLDLPIEVEVLARSDVGYSPSEASVVARGLYRAILGRKPDPEGERTTISDLTEGRLTERLDIMLRSAEFSSYRSQLTPTGFVEQVYLALLGRAPDISGLKIYRPAVERGRYRDVILAILGSEEFESRLVEAASER